MYLSFSFFFQTSIDVIESLVFFILFYRIASNSPSNYVVIYLSLRTLLKLNVKGYRNASISSSNSNRKPRQRIQGIKVPNYGR